jgi:hypothetical protein
MGISPGELWEKKMIHEDVWYKVQKLKLRNLGARWFLIYLKDFGINLSESRPRIRMLQLRSKMKNENFCGCRTNSLGILN